MLVSGSVFAYMNAWFYWVFIWSKIYAPFVPWYKASWDTNGTQSKRWVPNQTVGYPIQQLGRFKIPELLIGGDIQQFFWSRWVFSPHWRSYQFHGKIREKKDEIKFPLHFRGKTKIMFRIIVETTYPYFNFVGNLSVSTYRWINRPSMVKFHWFWVALKCHFEFVISSFSSSQEVSLLGFCIAGMWFIKLVWKKLVLRRTSKACARG